MISKIVKRMAAVPLHIRRCCFNASLPDSVYFFTFHKCASTLFGSYILKNIKDLQYVNYAKEIYSQKRELSRELTFEDRGCVYGPIRLSAAPTNPVYKSLVIPTSKHEFIKDKTAIFLVRDPRDILVSAFYSFGNTHGASPVKEIRELQDGMRETIKEKLIDEYVVEFADEQAANFQAMHDLSCVCERSVILKYEDMINDFDAFIAQLCKYIDIDDSVVKEIYKKSRPKQVEDMTAHRRSGQVGGFRDKLQDETITTINIKLADALKKFGYDS